MFDYARSWIFALVGLPILCSISAFPLAVSPLPDVAKTTSDMTSSRNSQSRPLSYISTSDLPKPNAVPPQPVETVPPWKEPLQQLQAKTKDLQNHLAKIPEQFQQGALAAFVIAIVLGCLYLITLLYTSPSCIYYSKVLLRIATEMLWLLLSWGIVAAICYYALTYLGGPSPEEASRTANGSVGSTAGSTNCEWTNEFLAWMYNNFHKVPGPLDAWIRSLNEIAKKVTSPAKCEVLFESFGDHSNVVRPPKITDIKAVKGPRDHITIYANVHFPCIKLKLISSQRVGDRLVVSNLDGNIIDLRGELECRVACIANQFYIVICFKGRPEMDIELTYSDPKQQQQQISFGLVEESIRRCLLSAVTHINLSDCWPAVNFEEDRRAGDFNRVNNAQVFSSMYSASMERKRTDTIDPYMQQPANRRSLEKPLDMLNISKLNESFNSSFDRQKGPFTSGYTANDYEHVTADPTAAKSDDSRGHAEVTDMFKKLNESNLVSPMINTNTVPNKLRVKVIKANRLGRNNKIVVQQPYVDIEMDEPSQKHSTSKGINANPYWEETFAFDLTPASEEILFEVYDASRQRTAAKDAQNNPDESFLGLCLVNFEEIRRSGEQLHVLKLQGTPYKKDDISGELTVQFDFYYDPTSSSVGKFVDTVRIRDKGGNEFRETVTLQRRALYDPHDNFDVNDITPTKSTTVVVKTVSHQLKEIPQIQSVHGSMENAIDPKTQKILEEQIRNSTDPKLQQLEAKLQKVESLRQGKVVEDRMARSYSGGAENQPQQTVDTRGRDRTKKNGQAPGEKRERSFFGELRDRLSGRRKSQKRSKSMDIGGPEVEEAVSLPPSRDASRTRYAVSQSGSGYLETQSVGGFSGESTKSLYQHSTLILEVDEDNAKKYFLIPPSILSEPSATRLMKRGRKLHIYNDHTFVAVKIRGGINCHVCQHRIKSSFSKQAYQCRDCKLVCHKSCHYKTDAFCTKSTVSKLHIAKDIDWAHFLSHYQLEEFISLEGV